MSGPVLRVAALSKRFGATQALTDVDLEVAHGETVGLSGANGAGKSTLLGVRSGFLQPGSGRIDHQPL